MDLSNKSLAMLLLAAIVISLGGTMVSLNKFSQLQAPGDLGITGRQTDTSGGDTNLTVNTVVGCSVDSNVLFGSLDAQDILINTTTDNSAAVGTLNNCNDASLDCEGMQVNNTGNVNVSVNFTSDSAASGFLGGPSVQASDFQFQVVNGTALGGTSDEPGCANNTGIGPWATWTDVSTSSTPICNVLTPDDANDAITTEFRVQVRQDTPGSSTPKSARITYDCTQV